MCHLKQEDAIGKLLFLTKGGHHHDMHCETDAGSAQV